MMSDIPRVLICGDRDWDDSHNLILNFVNSLLENSKGTKDMVKRSLKANVLVFLCSRTQNTMPI